MFDPPRRAFSSAARSVAGARQRAASSAAGWQARRSKRLGRKQRDIPFPNAGNGSVIENRTRRAGFNQRCCALASFAKQVYSRATGSNSTRCSSSSSSSAPVSALALRAEYFHDPDGGITPFSQDLWEVTLTFEYRPHPQLILKLEGRYDHSTAAAFLSHDPADPRHDQKLLVLGIVGTF